MWSYRRSIGKPQRVSVQTDVWAVVAELALIEESWHEVEEVEAVLYTMESGIVLSSPAAFVWKLLRQLERMKFCEVRRNAAPALHHMLASRLRWSEVSRAAFKVCISCVAFADSPALSGWLRLASLR